MDRALAPADVRVRPATPDDVPAVANVLDGAGLALDHRRLRESVERGATLVAVGPGTAAQSVDGEASEDGTPAEDGTSDAPGDAAPTGGTVVGALVREGDRVVAVAVRRRRRSQGIGSALVEAALARRGRLVASFDDDVRPFYEALGFAIEPAGEPGRYRGHRLVE